MHTGIAEGQSLLVLQVADGTHRPPPPHTVPGRDAQSAFLVHGTQIDQLVAHVGLLPEHCESMVHPGMQVKLSRLLQMGCAPPQSALSRQATHRPIGV